MKERAHRLFSFPDPVNEVSARLVAAGVVVLGVATLASGAMWLTAFIAYGFVARVLTGPTLSPLGLLVTRVLTPRLPVAPRYVPGPPKRFAQAIGAVVSVSAAVLALGLGFDAFSYALLGLLVVAASLEAAFALCVGCVAFSFLIRWGLVPKSVCRRCVDLRAEPASG